jgi:hypothetical protein
MIQPRAGELGMKVKIGCHTFRATGITAYLEAGGTLENAQAMAAHESPRTTASSTTAPATRSRSTRWNGLLSNPKLTRIYSSFRAGFLIAPHVIAAAARAGRRSAKPPENEATSVVPRSQRFGVSHTAVYLLHTDSLGNTSVFHLDI